MFSIKQHLVTRLYAQLSTFLTFVTPSSLLIRSSICATNCSIAASGHCYPWTSEAWLSLGSTVGALRMSKGGTAHHRTCHLGAQSHWTSDCRYATGRR
ncbi:hypothetical protein EDB89DRAFT_1957445 [Lactarius sanguifluus]|nr:hypothetical protein EDB89DRAFT_1957445 [Lactarius sanguifluus]